MTNHFATNAAGDTNNKYGHIDFYFDPSCFYNASIYVNQVFEEVEELKIAMSRLSSSTSLNELPYNYSSYIQPPKLIFPFYTFNVYILYHIC